MHIGLDVHKRLCYGTVTDDQGRIVRSGKFSSNPEGLRKFMDGLEKAQVAMNNRNGRSDPDTRVGRGRRGFILGYCVHTALCADSELPIAFIVAPCNENDKVYFEPLLERVHRLGIEAVNEDVMAELVAGMTRDDAVNYLVDVGLPVVPIYNIGKTVKDPHLIARGMFIEIEHPKAGKFKVPNFPVKFSETPGEITSAAPLLGQNNKEILMNLLGYSEEQVEQLDKQGVIATEK